MQNPYMNVHYSWYMGLFCFVFVISLIIFSAIRFYSEKNLPFSVGSLSCR